MVAFKSTIGLFQLFSVSDGVRRHQASDVSASCRPRPAIPPAPTTPLQYNGVSWPAYCFEGREEEHLFILGDWGGLNYYGDTVTPAKNTGHKRWFKKGTDDQAQKLVSEQMRIRARDKKPRLVLNGGDNFYWGGVNGRCGKPMADAIKAFSDPNNKATHQFNAVFEHMYGGEELENVPWLLCFGNHDYGGFMFASAWDQQIAYTWGPTNRWILPAQYWHQHVEFPTKDVTMDIYMIDTNNQDTTNPREDPGHNICSAQHNHGKSCAPFGPKDAYDCVNWFRKLWKAQVEWMYKNICESTADWQIIVTHFPPDPWTHYPQNVRDWKNIGDKCGIDFYVGSHRHAQEIHTWGRAGFPYVVAGGGGGITSEKSPGDNTQYGFFDMTIAKDTLFVESINQMGHVKGSMTVKKRLSEKQRKRAGMFVELSEDDAFNETVVNEFFRTENSVRGTSSDTDDPSDEEVLDALKRLLAVIVNEEDISEEDLASLEAAAAKFSVKDCPEGIRTSIEEFLPKFEAAVNQRDDDVNPRLVVVYERLKAALSEAM